MMPNYDAKYGDLSEVQADPRFMRLCAQQMAEMSVHTAKFAQERVQLALAIKRERDALRAQESTCPAPAEPCTCANGIGCVNEPKEQW